MTDINFKDWDKKNKDTIRIFTEQSQLLPFLYGYDLLFFLLFFQSFHYYI